MAREVMVGGGTSGAAAPEVWRPAAETVLEDGRARLRSVRVGRRNGSEAEVLEGLRAGERVVLYPTDNVEDGVRVAER
jgi:multidrug efflux pump subunit AcrA (membrane-fusion protein)